MTPRIPYHSLWFLVKLLQLVNCNPKFHTKIFFEFRDCRINLIEGTQDYFSKVLTDQKMVTPVTRLTVPYIKLGMSKFNETRHEVRRNCELLLGSYDSTAEIITAVQKQFQWLLACSKNIDPNPKDSPACYELHTYYILLKQLKKPYWRGMFRNSM